MLPAFRLVHLSRAMGLSLTRNSNSPRFSSTLATFHYLSPLEEYRTVKPFHINIPAGGIPGRQHTNEVSQPYHNVKVHDIREGKRCFSLDREGFEVAEANEARGAALLNALTPDQYQDSDLVTSRVAPKMEPFLRERLGAETVITFAFRFRRRDSQFPKLARGTDPNIAQPVQGVHADFTPDYARATANYVARRRNLLDPALQDRRWQLISAWRPLHGPLFDWPLAVLDSTSVDYSRDLIASDNVYPHQVSETYNVFFHEDHRWHYLSGHNPHEILLFKAFDSKTSGGTARVCAHAAFQLPNPPRNCPPRQSIECVSLVLYPRGTADKFARQTLPSETPADHEPLGAFNFY
ncbi:hypothetical protein QBC46DRAFT_373959 [Diplogelasinospora grovesii]|uniref:Uncharacterized protein n=1 Tax=Diplogelasinospora grovesii TaxID=303347 RepID=A0AAN6S8S0_9PEZI|nr:hypothetical protein QBC46DRAFT_373959 [Diplogelasinospora grovesii]